MHDDTMIAGRHPTSAPSVGYALPDHVRMCIADDVAVFLDLRRNRYFGLDARQTPTLTLLLSGHEPLASPTTQARTLAAFLSERQLLVPCNTACMTAQPAALPRPRISVGRQIAHPVRLTPRLVWRFLESAHWSRQRLRHDSLHAIAHQLNHDSRALVAPGSADTQNMIELALAFRRIRPFAFAARDQCLLHALTLVRFLINCQMPASWVIGVRIHPWRAHSWVQYGEYVLDATPEHVSEYTPILVT